MDTSGGSSGSQRHKSQDESSCCCCCLGREDLAVFVSLAAGTICTLLVVLDVHDFTSEDAEEYKWRLGLVQAPLAVTAVLAFLYTAPSCRRRLPSGLLAGAAAVLLGLGGALGLREAWEARGTSLLAERLPHFTPSTIQQSVRYFLSPAVEAAGKTKVVEQVRETIVSLLKEIVSHPQARRPVLGSVLGASAAGVLEFWRRRFRAQYRSLCTALAVIIYGSVTFLAEAILTTLAVFAVMPLSVRNAKILGRVFQAPPLSTLRGPHDQFLLVTLLGAGAAACWLTMVIRRPEPTGGSWGRTTLLGLLVTLDLLGVALSVVDVPAARGYVDFRQSTFVWQSLIAAAVLESVVALLHAGVAVPRPKKRSTAHELRASSDLRTSPRPQYVTPVNSGAVLSSYSNNQQPLPPHPAYPPYPVMHPGFYPYYSYAPQQQQPLEQCN